MSKVLIVVDMQNDFVSGSLGSPEAQEILGNIQNKIAKYRKNGDRIIFTQDTHHEDYLDTQEGRCLPVTHCIYGTNGWEIADGLGTEGCDFVQKPTFGYPDWEKEGLGNADEIELVGVCTDICVVTNALLLKTFFPEMKITVDAGCCAGTTPEKHQSALAVMQSCQVGVTGTDS